MEFTKARNYISRFAFYTSIIFLLHFRHAIMACVITIILLNINVWLISRIFNFFPIFILLCVVRFFLFTALCWRIIGLINRNASMENIKINKFKLEKVKTSKEWNNTKYINKSLNWIALKMSYDSNATE